MAIRSVVDIDGLLQPIPGDSPTGELLTSMSPEFDALKSGFSAAKVAERKLREELIAEGDEGNVTVDPPNWKSVVELATEILANRSKDLRAAAWLGEGLMRLHGFTGLRQSVQLFHQLCTQYWDQINPPATDDEGHRDAVSQFAGFMGESSLVPLNELPITRSSGGEEFSSIDFTEASELESISEPELREKRVAAGAITFTQLQDAVRKTDRMFYVELVQDLKQTVETLNLIEEFLNENCRADEFGDSTSPSVSTVRGRLTEILDNVERLAAEHLKEPEVLEEGVLDANGELITTTGEGAPVRQRMSTGVVVNREDAFEVLNKVASFFEHTEPHSPVSFALRQIITWGHMSLPELLRELIEDENVMYGLSKRIGLPRQTESES